MAHTCLSTRLRPLTLASRTVTKYYSQRKDPPQADNLLDIGIRKIFNEEHDIFRQSVRKFFKEEITTPMAKKRFVEQGYIDREVWLKAGENGMLGCNIPVKYGGSGGTILHNAIVWEEMWYSGDVHAGGFLNQVNNVAPYLNHFGTHEQKERYLTRMNSGECIASICFTEPHAGSDLQRITTSAKKDGDDWILNGSKIYITSGFMCDVGVVAATTGTEGPSAAHGITLFLVDMDLPGITKGPPLKKLGMAGCDTNQLFFEDVRIPHDAVLGEVGRGFINMMLMFPNERLMVAGFSIAAAEYMFELSRAFVRERKAFGKTIADLQVIQHKLAELKTQICVGRSFMDSLLWTHHLEGKLDTNTASMGKYWLSELANRVAYDCVQLHGGAGYMWEYPICEMFASIRISPIFAGTNEIMKEVIGRKIVQSK